jgi:hypothetical protein
MGRANARVKFLAGLGSALRIKEHRLLARDPWLISQMMMQALYTVPVGIVMWRHGGITSAPGVAFGPMLVIIAGQFSGALAWLALSAEDAPDFLMTAPATRWQIERAKLAAILEPVAITMAVPMLMLMWVAPYGAVIAIVCAAGASGSGALLMLWRQAPARRGMVLRRHSQSKVLALGEHWLSMLWAATDAIAAFGSWTFVAPLSLVVVTLCMGIISPASRPASGGDNLSSAATMQRKGTFAMGRNSSGSIGWAKAPILTSLRQFGARSRPTRVNHACASSRYIRPSPSTVAETAGIVSSTLPFASASAMASTVAGDG